MKIWRGDTFHGPGGSRYKTPFWREAAMSTKDLWLPILLFVLAAPVLAAAEPLPTTPAEPRPQAVPVVAPREGPSWAAELSRRLRQAAAGASFKRAKDARVRLSFTVTDTGQIIGVRGEGEPRAVERVLAAVRKIGNVPPPPDHKAHPVTVPIRFN